MLKSASVVPHGLVWAVWGVTLLVPPTLGTTIIVDNGDPGFTVLSGVWNTDSTSGQWGTDYRYKSTSRTLTAEVEWRPTMPTADDYTVSVWYPSFGGAQPNDACYTVHCQSGTLDVYVNQQLNGEQWVTLGTFPFAAGDTGRITLSDLAQKNKDIMADAVRFEIPAPPEPQFRGFWADVFHEGFKSTAEVDATITRALQGNYNAIVPEVLAYHDTAAPSHGAYWQSDIVARSSVVTEQFDPLAYMVQQAHAAGLEVHPWLVAFRISTDWPPPGNTYLADRPEWLMVPQINMGSVAMVGDCYTFDPGCPGVQNYLVSIVRELVERYEIDGIHWDYIRYTQTDAGYPADVSFSGSSLSRFQQITGRADIPSPTGDTQWNDFRRRTITEIIRRVRAEIPAITTNPRQPLRHTAALIPWGDAPSSFSSSSAYALFQDWELWMRQGYLDAGCPMLYYREHLTDQAQWYRNWINACLNWRYDRHMYTGAGIYLNTMPNSVTQLQYALQQGTDGIVTYSYAATNSTGDPWADWYPYVAANLFSTAVLTPSMPWRDPALATEGTLWGRVTDVTTGLVMDDATVEVGSLSPVQSDGNGFYVVTLIPATPPGTTYSVTASRTGYPPAVSDVLIGPGQVTRQDFALGSVPPPEIELNQISFTHRVILGDTLPDDTFAVRNSGDGTLSYSINDDVTWLSESPNAGTSTGEWDTVLVTYDLTGLGLGPHQAQIDVTGFDATNSPQSISVMITIMIPGDFDFDGDVDQIDFGHIQTCLTGESNPQTDETCLDTMFDDDNDVDQEDVLTFLGCLSGSGIPASPDCAN